MPGVEPQRVLFIGLGAMGSLMTPHLAALEEIDLLVTDQDVARAAELADRIGATAIAPEDVLATAADAAVVILMLPDSTVVESILSDAFLDALRPGTLIIDMGSSRPASTVATAQRASERGVEVLDAPVSGGTQRAATGTLTIMVGATDAGFEAGRPFLSPLGNQISHVGEPGAGHALKALNNLLSAIGLAAASEVLAVGTRFGLNTSTMLDVLNTATGRNHATEVKFAPFVLTHEFNSGFALRLMVKDLRLALDLAEHTDTSTPLSQAALARWIEAEQSLPADADHTHFAAFVEEKAHVRFE